MIAEEQNNGALKLNEEVKKKEVFLVVRK